MPSKVQIEQSPSKIKICDDTYLCIQNLDMSDMKIQFDDVWQLVNKKSGMKHNYTQMYSDRLYQQYSSDMPNVLPIPDILQIIK